MDGEADAPLTFAGKSVHLRIACIYVGALAACFSEGSSRSTLPLSRMRA